MKVKSSLILWIVFVNLLVFDAMGQNARVKFKLTSKNSDCSGAIDISKFDSVEASVPIGAGQVQNFNSQKGDLRSFEKEHNVVWYSLTIAQDAVLSLKIIPFQSTDDYDFLLIQATDCQGVNSKAYEVVRSNISRSDQEREGITGLSEEGMTPFVHEGKGNAFSVPIEVMQGEHYFLVVDNVYEQGQGHLLVMEWKTIVKPVEGQKQYFQIIDTKDSSKMTAWIKVFSREQLQGQTHTDTLVSGEIGTFELPMDGKHYYLELSKEGYFSQSRALDRIGEQDTLYIGMKSMAVGSTVVLENIHFQGGSAIFTGNSQTALRQLYKVMKDNPNLVIEIQGHVNLADNSNSKKTEEYYNQLSTDRAKAVYDYLKKRGISEDRMEYRGYGYSNMINPRPKTLLQMEQNRRVEILILKN